MKWEKKRIEELCTYFVSGGTPLSSKKEYYFPAEIPWLNTKEVNFNRVYDTEKKISCNGLKNSSAKLIPINSVIMAMYGQGDTAGRVAINKIVLTTNQACCNLIIDSSKADYRFIYFLLKNDYKKIVVLKNGGAQPNLNVSLIKNYVVKLPPLPIQERIADILSAYDDLIENNQKQIKLLEEAAQRLYKEWFVDFRFPGHETTPIVDGIPEGWEKKKICEVLKYDIGGGWGEDHITEKSEIGTFVIRGTDLYNITHGASKDLPFRYQSSSSLSPRKLHNGDIIFEVSGGSKNEGVARTALITQKMLDFWNKPVICASFCKLVRVLDISLSQFIYDVFGYMRKSGITTRYDKKSASSIVNYRWKDFLYQEQILLPQKNILQKYNAIAKTLYNKIVSLSQGIETAKEARDRLLPKLMSGEIDLAL